MVLRPNLFTFERIKEAVQQPAFRSLADKIGVLGQAGHGGLLMHAVTLKIGCSETPWFMRIDVGIFMLFSV